MIDQTFNLIYNLTLPLLPNRSKPSVQVHGYRLRVIAKRYIDKGQSEVSISVALLPLI